MEVYHHFFRTPTLTSGSFAAPWATRMHSSHLKVLILEQLDLAFKKSVKVLLKYFNYTQRNQISIVLKQLLTVSNRHSCICLSKYQPLSLGGPWSPLPLLWIYFQNEWDVVWPFIFSQHFNALSKDFFLFYNLVFAKDKKTFNTNFTQTRIACKCTCLNFWFFIRYPFGSPVQHFLRKNVRRFCQKI